MTWLVLAAFVGPLLAACVTDLFRRRIPNWLCALHALLALAALPLIGFPPADLGMNAAVALGVLLVCLPLFSRGLFGGGDVKLLVSTSLWVGWSGLSHLLIGMAVAGLPVALFVLGSRGAARLLPEGGLRAHLAWQGETVPYGFAITAGGILAMPWIFV